MGDEPTGILALPHFAGAATPYMDVGSKGAIVGLDLSKKPADIYKAILEGVAYEMRLNMETLAKSGIVIKGLFATGGCARSKPWLQIKADVLGVPITRMGRDEAGTIGGIMLTGVATGVYGSLGEAREILVKEQKTYTADRERAAIYESHYERYRGLYRAVRPLV